eukprot:Pgem_evm1s3064
MNDFHRVLEVEESRNLFLLYLEKEQSQENLLFLEAVEKYKKYAKLLENRINLDKQTNNEDKNHSDCDTNNNSKRVIKKQLSLILPKTKKLYSSSSSTNNKKEPNDQSSSSPTSYIKTQQQQAQPQAQPHAQPQPQQPHSGSSEIPQPFIVNNENGNVILNISTGIRRRKSAADCNINHINNTLTNYNSQTNNFNFTNNNDLALNEPVKKEQRILISPSININIVTENEDEYQPHPPRQRARSMQVNTIKTNPLSQEISKIGRRAKSCNFINTFVSLSPATKRRQSINQNARDNIFFSPDSPSSADTSKNELDLDYSNN